MVWASSYGQTIGGGPVLTPMLMAALASRGHEIVVLTDRRPTSLAAEEFRDGVRIVRPPFRQALAGDMPLLVSIRRLVADLKGQMRPDAVHIFSSGYGEFFHHATSEVHRAPLAVTLHDSFPAEAYRSDALVGRNLRAAAWVAACSAAVLETAIGYVPEVAATGTVVLNALPQVEVRGAIAGPRPGRLVYAGRLVHHKGVDNLIAAMALLAGRYPDLNLTIAGDGEARGALESEVARRALGDRVTFAGAVPHARVYEEMTSAVMVVVPSRIEPFGLVALEAAQMGRPVVAAAVGGLPEVVVDGQTGLLVPPDDPPALAEAVAALLDDPHRAAQLGEAARRRALEHFRWDGFVDTYDAALRRIAFR